MNALVEQELLFSSFSFFFFKNLLDIAQPGFAHQSVFSTGHKWEVQSDTNIVDKIWLLFQSKNCLLFFGGGGGWVGNEC